MAAGRATRPSARVSEPKDKIAHQRAAQRLQEPTATLKMNSMGLHATRTVASNATHRNLPSKFDLAGFWLQCQTLIARAATVLDALPAYGLGVYPAAPQKTLALSSVFSEILLGRIWSKLDASTHPGTVQDAVSHAHRGALKFPMNILPIMSLNVDAR